MTKTILELSTLKIIILNIMTCTNENNTEYNTYLYVIKILKPVRHDERFVKVYTNKKYKV